MSVKELEKAVTGLSAEEFKEFRDWFAEFEWEQWDSEIVKDSKSGKFKKLIETAMSEHRAGKTKKL